jgi:hypothetical protein
MVSKVKQFYVDIIELYCVVSFARGERKTTAPLLIFVAFKYFRRVFSSPATGDSRVLAMCPCTIKDKVGYVLVECGKAFGHRVTQNAICWKPLMGTGTSLNQLRSILHPFFVSCTFFLLRHPSSFCKKSTERLIVRIP